MIRLGFLGVQSKHAEYFGTIFNKDNIYDDIRVTSLWGGDAPERIEIVSNELGIKNILSTPSQLINEVDAVLVLLRDGNCHMQYAVEALKKGIPVFVDKPFATKPEDARSIVNTAVKTKTPLFGGSTLRHLPNIASIKKRVDAGGVSHISIRYSADISSPFGGYYFYGSHLAEMCVTLCGADYIGVKSERREDDVCAVVKYPNLIAMLHSSSDTRGLEISIYGENAEHFKVDESNCYRYGMEKFVQTIKTGIPQLDYYDLIKPVEMLDAIVSSF